MVVSLVDLLILFAAALAATGWFSASSLLVNQLPHAALVAGALVVGSVVVYAFSGLPTPARIRRLGTKPAVGAAVSGILLFAVAPLVVLALRRTDAPSGSEVLFFTTAAWGALAVITASLSMRRSSLVQLAGAGVGLLGAATILANWERPSSFSPMVKFPDLEIGMLLAGVAFAAASRYLVGLVRAHGLRSVLAVAWSAALAFGVIAAAVSLVASPSGASQLSLVLSMLLVQVLLAGLSAGAFAVAWVSSLRHLGLARSASALFLPPVILTVVAATEGVVRSATGANPVQWSGALGGVAIVGVAVVALLGFEAPDPVPPRPAQSGWIRTSLLHGVSVLAAGLALVGLVWPVFEVTLSGALAGKPWSVTWEMIGAETSLGWLAVAVAFLALAFTFDADRFSWPFLRRLAGLGLVAITALSWPFVAETPLRTWTRWLPAEVLQDLGTEYAQMEFVRVAYPIGVAAIALAVAVAIAMTALSIPWAAAGRHQTESS